MFCGNGIPSLYQRIRRRPHHKPTAFLHQRILLLILLPLITLNVQKLVVIVVVIVVVHPTIRPEARSGLQSRCRSKRSSCYDGALFGDGGGGGDEQRGASCPDSGCIGGCCPLDDC